MTPEQFVTTPEFLGWCGDRKHIYLERTAILQGDDDKPALGAHEIAYKQAMEWGHEKPSVIRGMWIKLASETKLEKALSK